MTRAEEGQVRQLLWSRQGGWWWPGARRRALLGVVLRVQGNEGRSRKEKKRKGKKKKGGKEEQGRKGRERGGCVGGIRGDGHERGVEHAARRVGRGTEKGWRLIFGCQKARRQEMFWAIKSSDGRGF
jgi:hypothetical protein